MLLVLVLIALSALYWQRRLQMRCHERLTVQRGADEIETLITELEDLSSCVRSAAAFDLQKTGLGGADAVPALTALLHDSSDYVRWRAAAALGHIFVAAPDTIRSLIAALQDDNPKVRYNAIYSLGKLSAAEAAQPMAALALDPDPEARHNAIYTLRFVTLPTDREWLCPMLSGVLRSGADGWLVAAETAGMVGCVELIHPIREASERWSAKCPTMIGHTTNEESATKGIAWALSPTIGRECSTAEITHQILEITLKRLSIRKTLEGEPA